MVGDKFMDFSVFVLLSKNIGLYHQQRQFCSWKKLAINNQGDSFQFQKQRISDSLCPRVIYFASPIPYSSIFSGIFLVENRRSAFLCNVS